MTKYSQAELKLFKELMKDDESYTRFLVNNKNVYARHVYEYLVTKVFIENQAGPAVEALRRVVRNLDAKGLNLTIYRMTPEFDKLCEF